MSFLETNTVFIKRISLQYNTDLKQEKNPQIHSTGGERNRIIVLETKGTSPPCHFVSVMWFTMQCGRKQQLQ